MISSDKVQQKTTSFFTAGFNMIEILIVIAILGILSSITLVALNKSRDKAQDAKVKVQLVQIKAESELYFDQNGNYGTDAGGCAEAGSFFSDPQVTLLINAALAASGATTATCVSDNGSVSAGNATTWAFSVPLRSDPLTTWCVDSEGTNAEGLAQISGNTASCQ